MTQLMNDQKVPLYGNGENIRNWMYVEDNCRGIELLLRKGKAGEIYNLGTDNHLTNLQLTHKLLQLFNKDESSIEFVPDRLGHDQRYSIDSSKAAALGWKPEWDFDEALRLTANWYRDLN